MRMHTRKVSLSGEKSLQADLLKISLTINARAFIFCMLKDHIKTYLTILVSAL